MDKFTGKTDINGNEIYGGMTLEGKTIDGDHAEFTVIWSDYRKDWIAENPDEIYDVSSKIFHKYEIVG
ncbi:hypothetical protein [Bacillus haynesii]|uniref:hypothetical protein n=1 Tax=Bacillus haynesii TaxID=1925021 RepID=UPI00227E5E86|nr:hypothetical protein [Bacillus haynesii]MCY8408985.1 hypothetical protein [Bacillus haynesii]MCY8433466.1 hypothetical protein [Bacillus haynesii]MCY8557854.1 hypothetical protein [Bacillus haynesii]MEC0709617.1 hypothetical protein [Bacillus haynesii]MEC0719709.1 hypothetical protein [Bacillus haynesii]